MINRQHRFHGRNSLRRVYQQGQTVRGASLMLRTVPNSQRSHYRAAVVVSRKVSKSAVVRNRIRRRLYEILRAQEPLVVAPCDLVITAFSEEIAHMPYEQLDATVRNLLRKAAVIPADASIVNPPHDIVSAKERKI